MIKKTTKAIFRDGSYEGEYDWAGGIPLSEREIVTVTTSNNKQIDYTLVKKTVNLKDEGENQFVHVEYVFDTSA